MHVVGRHGLFRVTPDGTSVDIHPAAIFALHHPGDGERVNLRIPIPIPLVGLLLPSQPPVNQALRLRNLMAESDNPAKTLETYLDSLMAIEFIRVEEDDGELVIIGLD